MDVRIVAAVAGLSLLAGAPVAADDPVPRCWGRAVTIQGTDGYDVLRGTSGDDVIAAGPGKDVIWGGAGDDRICAGAGRDRVHGQRGMDRLAGGRANDVIDDPDEAVVSAGRGVDGIMLARPGRRSSVDAGPDPDRIVIDTVVGDFSVQGSYGRDQLIWTGAGVTVDLKAGYLQGAGGGVRLRSIEGVEGGPGDDRLYGTDRSNWLHGGPDGDDRLFGRGGDDELWGKLGADTLAGGAGTDTCYDDAPDDPSSNIDCEEVMVDIDHE